MKNRRTILANEYDLVRLKVEKIVMEFGKKLYSSENLTGFSTRGYMFNAKKNGFMIGNVYGIL